MKLTHSRHLITAAMVAVLAAAGVGCMDNDRSTGGDRDTGMADPGSSTTDSGRTDARTAYTSDPQPISARSRQEGELGRISVPGLDGRQAIEVTRTGKAEAKVGQPYEYTLVVRNTSSQPLSDVVVREEAPAGFSIASAAGGDDQQQQQQTGGAPTAHTVRIGTLQPDEERRIVVRGQPNAEGPLQVCTSVSFQPQLCSSIQVVKPDLAIERWISVEGERVEGAVYACDPLTLNYRVTNTGTGTADNVRIVDQLPEGISTAEGGAQQQLEIPVGALPSGQSETRSVDISATAATRLEQPARALSDSDQAEDGGQALVIMKPDLQLQVDGPSEHYLGRPASYRIRVTNPTDHPVLDVAVQADLPDNLQRPTISSQRVQTAGDGTFRIGRLEPREQVEFSIDFDASEAGNLVTPVSVSGYCVDEKRQEIATRVLGVPAVRLEMVDVRDPVPVGENTTYEIRVQNQGSAEDLDIQLRAQLPEQMEMVQGSGTTQVQGSGKNVDFAPLERLAPGETATWQIEVRATDPGDAHLDVEMTSKANPRAVREQEPTKLY